ncbi:MAG TPA: SRPBCC family protein [Streptosporangiaceae bacterium]|nr:SRPBCC family protein [Streptosporangiaceae bacterium]
MGKTEFVIEPGRQDIIIRRVFDAPPDVVFTAFTDPAIVARWMGPAKYEAKVEHWDASPGGGWRFIHRDSDDGTEYAFKGVFHDVVAPSRLVRTFEYEGWPGHVSLETATFEEIDGRTQFVGVSVFQSVEDRDGMVKSGMEEGAGEGYDRLNEIVRSM